MMNTRARRQVGCVARSAVILVLAVVAFSAVAESTASAKTWYLTISPARVERGGNVAIETTNHAKCRVTLRVSGYVFHYTMRGGQKLLAIPRTETPGRWRVRVDCGRTHAINSFTVLNSVLGARTPITVANVCALDPALGTVHTETVTGYPTAYWTDGSGAHVTMLAYSIDGNSSVDVAVVASTQGGIAYFARCSWSRWLTVAQYEQSQAQQGVSSAQASSFAYLLQEQTDNSIYEEDSDWFTPEPGWQECPANPYDDCYYEDTDDGT